jgi:HK97 family phage prohead protease
MGSAVTSINAIRNDPFTILKSNNLVIGGYASIEMVDKQNDLITLDALQEAVNKYMKITKFRNVMTNHSNVQVGEVIPSYRDKTGKLYKTEVDDVGFFVVIKMREDIEKAKEVGREIRDGSLRSFSIGGQALEKRKKTHKEYGEYNEISKLELHEVTICEKGINPEAKFDILKMDKGDKMNAISKALEELNKTLDAANSAYNNESVVKMQYLEVLTSGDYKKKDVIDAMKEDMENTTGKVEMAPYERVLGRGIMEKDELRQMVDQFNAMKDIENTDSAENVNKNIEKNQKTSEGTEMVAKEDEEIENAEEDVEAMNPNMPDEKMMDEKGMGGEYMDTERKSKPDLATGQVEAGNAGEYVDDAHPQLDSKYMAKFEDQSTLDLSAENLEKAYAEFKAEQLEKMAFDKVKDSFQARFDSEMVAKTEEIEKANYDAKAEVSELRKQFADLLNNLKAEEETVIRKQEEAVAELNIPNGDEIAKMDWSDINALVERLEGQL